MASSSQASIQQAAGPRDNGRRRLFNLCVIAHVDHGKTTLSDSLLARAHILSDGKAGSALALDYDKEEQLRGITINSTGVTLRFPDWVFDKDDDLGAPSVSATSVPLPPPSTAKAMPTSDTAVVYVGNLPWPAIMSTTATASDDDSADSDLDAEVLRAQLTTHFAQFGPISSVELRARRGFAVVTFHGADAAISAVQGTQDLVLGGRTAVVEQKGQSAVLRLAQTCVERSLMAPSYTANADGSITVAIAGTTITATSPPGLALKEAKHAAATQALALLDPPSIAQPRDLSPTIATPDTEDTGVDDGLTVNLIDCPGHVDFSGEVTAALRLTDGALVLVDPVDCKGEGLCVQTETVLRQALAERVRPVLFLNKIDRVITELQCTPEEAYRLLAKTVDSVNAVIRAHQPEGCDFTVAPDQGTVAFGSGLMRWAFTLDTFARVLARPDASKADRRKLMARLWGDNFLDKKAGRWSSSSVDADGAILPRGFCVRVLQPIYDLFLAARDGNLAGLAAMATKLGVEPRKPEAEPTGKTMLKAIMQAWLPLADQVLQLVVAHLPTPREAQAYRAASLYDGPADDAVCTAMKTCDAAGPVMVYVSKMFQPIGKAAKHLVAFGRIFSGTVRPGMSVLVCGPRYQPGGTEDVATARVQSVMAVMGGRTAPLAEGCAGMIVGLAGIEQHLAKTGTITTSPDAFPMRVLQFSVAPVVRAAIHTSGADRQALTEAMRLLAKTDPCIQCYVDPDTGEDIMAGAGELHIEVRVNMLRDTTGLELRVADPVVQYAETVIAQGPVCLAKSGNKHNRLFVHAAPLTGAVVDDLAAGTITMAQPQLERVRRLSETHGWERDVARRILAIEDTNIFMDGTTGINLASIRDNMLVTFREVCARGVLAGEPLRGLLFTVVDAKVHSDSAHRRADQICPATRRALSAAVLTASPRLMEPVFLVDVQCPSTVIGDLTAVLKKRRGAILSDEVTMDGSLHNLRAHLPVARSFGFNGEARGATSGRAFPQVSFSHWQTVASSPLEPGTEAHATVTASRERKRLKPSAVPVAADFLDTM